MTIEFALLKDLAHAIEAVRTTKIACNDACHAAWAAPSSALPVLDANVVATRTAMAHAKHELAAALAAAQAHINAN